MNTLTPDMHFEAVQMNMKKMMQELLSKFNKHLPDQIPNVRAVSRDRFDPTFFPIQGMYGGFFLWLEIRKGELILHSRGGSRICSGSTFVYTVTKDKYQFIRREMTF
ncbi:MAG TPA: hypothetical protein PKN56_05290 [Leptospiraceae bacterium]|nr:hypothetical protein [Leptospiraceae bacterium]HNI94621.1 hypothetical protein [Leptospiraceae bacterium]HNM02227.1 hypothetical protein [Leptospiraceae bacterium]HNN02955.1 hypothetical protein [Leptospiraceae bacterium]HNO24066.1 hypothetical protein [Leptospiraceae bacterium]